jgi:uncharacterized repeat protein (TIGR03987 family)
MPISTIFICLALCFYTISILSERRKKSIKLWMVVVMGAGLVSDFVGTGIMFTISSDHSLNSHTVCGYTALIIMLLHFIWAIMAAKKNDKAQQFFTRYSIVAWFVWMVAFFSGMPKVSV